MWPKYDHFMLGEHFYGALTQVSLCSGVCVQSCKNQLSFYLCLEEKVLN